MDIAYHLIVLINLGPGDNQIMLELADAEKGWSLHETQEGNLET